MSAMRRTGVALALLWAAGCSSEATAPDTVASSAREWATGGARGPLCKAKVHGDDDACEPEDDDDRCEHGDDSCSPPPPPPATDGGGCGDDAGHDGGSAPSPPTPPPPCGFTDYSDGLVGGQISDVAYDPRAAGVAWTAAGSRLFKSTDNGATWTMVYEGTAFGFRKLAIPPGDPKVLYAATSSGIARSTDGGQTWTVLGLSGLSISTMLVHPAQPLRVYAAVRGAGILRSNDGGLTWGSIDNGVVYGEFLSMTTDPANPDVLFVAEMALDLSGGFTGAIIWRTADAGVSWSRVQDNPKSITYEVAACPADPNVMYAASVNYYGGVTGVLRSADRGLTWQVTQGLAGKLVSDVAIAPTDCNSIYAVHYGVGLKRSTDGGATFSAPLTNGIPFANNFPRHVAVDPASTARILGASHAGLLFSQDAGDHFSVVGGVMNLAIRSLGVSPTDSERLWMATWGSGLWVRPDSTTSWRRGGLNVDYTLNVSPDPAVAARTFFGTWSYPYVTTDGTTFSSRNVPYNPFGFAFDPTNTSTIYMATQIKGLFKSTDSGATWTASNGSLTPWDVGDNLFIDMRSVAVDRSNANRILVGTNARGVYRSEDGGATLVSVAPALAGKVVSCLVQASDGAFYACVDGSGIAKSSDGGATFAFVNDGLPSLNVGGLTADGSTLYSTSNLGVFTSTNGGGSWTALDTACLPAGGAGVLSVVGTGATKKLVVATGRGVFAHVL